MSQKDSKSQADEQTAEYEGPMGADERYGRNQQYGQGDNTLLDRHSGDDAESNRLNSGEHAAGEEAIGERLRRALDQSGLDVANVQISVADNRVTLDGETMDDLNRDEIEKLATQAGAGEVRNLVRVRRGVSPDLGATADSEDVSQKP